MEKVKVSDDAFFNDALSETFFIPVWNDIEF